ncbi:hypothetical protein HF325_000480 [Metschnikowia pulcherrima]|uniref:Putative transcription factor kapC n=1 Tax=Metschnikowia pulcherrima TaxID=27326 RepID=A0A8H7LEN5_9ASCO|nr:hypothetical protein HF325_000480 [Metschnikowia pulcherrima]
MQKELARVTVTYPWKEVSSSTAIYKKSGESLEKTSKDDSKRMSINTHQQEHLEPHTGSSADVSRHEELYNTGSAGQQIALLDQNEESNTTIGILGRTQNSSSVSALPEILSPEVLERPSPARQAGSESSRPVRPKALQGTKRAAQNRSAQRAFRERREKYVRDLEATALQVTELQKTVDQLRQENTELRGYTLALQTRLIELNPSESNHLP